MSRLVQLRFSLQNQRIIKIFCWCYEWSKYCHHIVITESTYPGLWIGDLG